MVQVKLFTECDMTMEPVVLNECRTATSTKTLKSCTKEILPKTHTKEVYECKPVTKQHCTTVWEIINNQKVWTGNNDCKDVTWEECSAVKKDVTFMVPTMKCKPEPHPYMDYVAKPRKDEARKTKCRVRAEKVCEPVEREKCAEIKYKVCSEVTLTLSVIISLFTVQEKVEEDCTDYDVLVPFKKRLHLKWCLLDGTITDFNKEVEKVPGGGLAEESASEFGEYLKEDNVDDGAIYLFIDKLTDVTTVKPDEITTVETDDTTTVEETDENTTVNFEEVTSAKSDDEKEVADSERSLQKFPFGLNLRRSALETGREKRQKVRASGLAIQKLLKHSSFRG